ncbi:glycosyltransferase family 2 protein [bacterium]|nr:glycosyltransferase family 2 protein [bacterium]
MELTKTNNRPFEISIIAPFYNEEENLPQLYEEVTSVMHEMGVNYEIIFVDDGSVDKGPDLIKEWAKKDNAVKLVQLSRNFGQTAAMSAGFDYANGKIYVAIDADNQNDPTDIPDLVTKLKEGFDIVSGWRKKRKDKMFTRRIPSMIANKLISKSTGVNLHDYGCSLKAYKAEFIDSISLYGEMHRFIPIYSAMAGAKVGELPVNHRARTRGKTKYGLNRIFKVIMDLITIKFLSAFSTKPSYLFGGIGMTFCALGIFSGIEVLLEKYIAGTFAHRNPFLLLAVFLFILGILSIMMGLIAELLIRIYHESQGKRIYLVKDKINLE